MLQLSEMKKKNDIEEEEYLEIKEQPTLKRRNSYDITENTIQTKLEDDLNNKNKDKEKFNDDKNNLLNELRKSLPNLIPKNMIN